jgi:hypothetical protein
MSVQPFSRGSPRLKGWRECQLGNFQSPQSGRIAGPMTPRASSVRRGPGLCLAGRVATPGVWRTRPGRSTHRYVRLVAEDEAALTAAIVARASEFGRYGYRRVTALLRRDGRQVNHKRSSGSGGRRG